MLNSEHYHDPTASKAIGKVSQREQDALRNSQRKYFSTPVYVPQKRGGFLEKQPEISEMTLEELSPYINSCVKATMDPTKCIDCVSRCKYGKRAVEIMEQETNPKKINKGTVTMRMKAMNEYQAAIDSGDILKYAIEHSRSKSNDPKKVKAAAVAKISFWRKNYGGIIKEVPKANPAPVEQIIESKAEKSPLIDMPCLSKKVAAEEAQRAEPEQITKLFALKLETLRNAVADIQRQVEELNSNKNSIEHQISTIEATARLLGVSI